MFVVITGVSVDNRIIKHKLFTTEQAAIDFLNRADIKKNYPDAFTLETLGQGSSRDWVVDRANNTLLYEPVPVISPPTSDEIYDEVMQNQRILKALAQVCAEQFGWSGTQMKSAIKGKM